MRLFRKLNIEQVKIVNRHILESKIDNAQRLYKLLDIKIKTFEAIDRARSIYNNDLASLNETIKNIITSQKKRLINLLELIVKSRHLNENIKKRAKCDSQIINYCKNEVFFKEFGEKTFKYIFKNKDILNPKDIEANRTFTRLIEQYSASKKKMQDKIKRLREHIINVFEIILEINGLSIATASRATAYNRQLVFKISDSELLFDININNNIRKLILEAQNDRQNDYPQNLEFSDKVNKSIMKIITCKNNTELAPIVSKIKNYLKIFTLNNIRMTLRTKATEREGLLIKKAALADISNDLRNYLDNNEDENQFTVDGEICDVLSSFIEQYSIYDYDFEPIEEIREAIKNNQNSKARAIFEEIYYDANQSLHEVTADINRQFRFFINCVSNWASNITESVKSLFDDHSFMKENIALTITQELSLFFTNNLITLGQLNRLFRIGRSRFTPTAPARNSEEVPAGDLNGQKLVFIHSESDSESETEEHATKRQKTHI